MAALDSDSMARFAANASRGNGEFPGDPNPFASPRRKNLVDMIQEDFPRTPSPVYQKAKRAAEAALQQQLLQQQHAAAQMAPPGLSPQHDPSDALGRANDLHSGFRRVEESIRVPSKLSIIQNQFQHMQLQSSPENEMPMPVFPPDMDPRGGIDDGSFSFPPGYGTLLSILTWPFRLHLT